MRIRATDLYTLERPYRCELRLFLDHRGEVGERPGAFEQLLFRLGNRYEAQYVGTLGEPLDLKRGSVSQREEATRQAVGRKEPAIYQARFRAEVDLATGPCEVVGEPDLLLCEEGGYVIRDVKIARRIDPEHHPEIIGQLNVYGWLFEQTVGEPPVRLEVLSGTGDVVEVLYEGGAEVRRRLEEIAEILSRSKEPYSPVGWSKCDGCRYRKRCWSQAEARRDVALVPDVSQAQAHALRAAGVHTIDHLAHETDPEELAAIEHPHGQKKRRFGGRAAGIIQRARALANDCEELIEAPDLPVHPNYAMFDLEGLPPGLDESGRIYLWGLKVFGTRPSEFQPAVATLEDGGDEKCWFDFLGIAESILAEHGDIPFVHWASYEATHLRFYRERYGDRKGVAVRVERNLLDLLPVTKNSVVLPLPSYSLKVIERYVGVERSQDEYGGSWSIATFIEAIETKDAEKRERLIEEILRYNEEDLDATWAVLEWLRAK